MDNPYEKDKERLIEMNEKTEQCLEEFKTRLSELYPDVNIEAVLEKPIINSDTIISYGMIEFVKTNKKEERGKEEGRKEEKINSNTKELNGNNDKQLNNSDNSKDGQFIYYHMFRKRHTVEFDVIIRGFASKYQLFDMLCLLSQDERDRILKCDFDTIWNDYWVDHDNGGYRKLYKKSKEKFSETRQLLKIIDKYIPCKLNVRPLIFPKGRKSDKETPLEAALREAQEEIKVPFKSERQKREDENENNTKTKEIYFNDPIVRHYIGSDGKKYTDYYYVWKRENLYKCPTQKLGPSSILSNPARKSKERLRTETIGHELEADIWIEIPIFSSKTKQWEWENSIDPYARYGIFQRHFKILLEIHSRLTE